MAEDNTQDSNNPENAAAAASNGGQSAVFQVQKLYIKDVSFEVPNAPEVFKQQAQTDINLNLSQRVDDLGDDLYDVTLTVTATATMGEQTAYLAEVAQCGIFQISGMNEQSVHAAVNTLCPNTLFPYARSIITSLVSDGGFPPLILQPVNWDAVYGQRLQQAQQEALAQQSAAGEA